jgi:hypothetical protein
MAVVRFPSAASQKLTEPPSLELVGHVPLTDIGSVASPPVTASEHDRLVREFARRG